MTPEIISRKIEYLINKLNATHEYIYLDVEPEPDQKVNDCFLIVQKKVEKSGGKMIMGWQIWEGKHLIEAECHAVWEDLNEELHDISPKKIPISKILFVEDSNLSYDNKQIDSVRINITNNQLVNDLIDVCKAIHEFENKGERALLYEYDLSNRLDDKQKKHRKYLIELKRMINQILETNGNRNSLCPCGKGFRFKDCHGEYMKSRISRDV